MDTLVADYVSWFGPAHRALSLLPVGIAAASAILWIFRRASDPAGILRIKKRLQAHLLEMRLYDEDPRVMWRAQTSLLRDNLVYLRFMLKPALWTLLPMALLLVQLDRFYGRAPLPVGEPALISAQMRGLVAPDSPAPLLKAPPGIAIETPAVRVLRENRIYWRIRPLRTVSGTLQLVFPWGVVEKSVDAGASPRPVSPVRAGSFLDLLRYPGEPRLRAAAVASIEILYPDSTVEVLGFHLHWVIVFLVFSTAAAWLLKGRFGVTL